MPKALSTFQSLGKSWYLVYSSEWPPKSLSECWYLWGCHFPY